MSIDISKIIHGVVGGGQYTVTSPIVKEDYGLYLLIEGLELPSTYEVDFSNSEHNGTSVTMIGNADGVLIPSQFIKSGKDVFAFLYHVGEDFGRTVYKFRIPNKLRPDRTNEEPTPEEQSVIDQAISALNSAVTHTAQDVIDADESAQSAQGYAEQAETARDTAQGYATQAQTSANSASASVSQASASATASAQSASQSAQIKADVEDLVDDAQASASASAQSATASANSASQASASATSASQSASSAQGYASQAQTSAQTASVKATEASGYADTSSQKASESAQSASLALGYKNDALQAKTDAETAQASAEQARDDAQTAQELAENAEMNAGATVHGVLDSLDLETTSGSIVETHDAFPVSPEKMVVDINPVQDLHGQESPYPAGGGKNKFDKSAVTISDLSPVYKVSDGSVYDGTRSGFDYHLPNGTYTIKFTACDAGCEYVNAHVLNSDNSLVDSVFRLTTTTSAATLAKTFTITNGQFLRVYRGTTNALDISGVNIQIEEGTTATDYAPYENICPISGWTGMNVRRCNENLWDDAWYSLGNTMNLITDEASDFYGYYRGAVASWANAQKTYGLKNLFPNGVDRLTVTADYACASDAGAFNYRVYFYYSDGTSAYNSNIEVEALGKRTATRVSASGKKCIGFVISTNAGTSNYRGAIKNIIVSADGVTNFVEPVQNPLIPISWQTEAGTVYGGKLDVLSGVLRVEFADVDLGTLTWTYQESYHRFNSSGIASRVKIPSSSNVNIGGICSAYVVRSVSQVILNDNGLGVSTSGTIGIIDTRFTDPTEFKTAVDGVHYVYPLATPIEIQLDGHTINSLYGQNNIFADTGDVSVEYRADTTLYIQRLTEPDADMIADSNIVSGQYFMVGNNLYKATANIASGSAVIVGTNAVRKSLSEALNEINA